MNDIITIPQSATVEIQDKKFVFVLQPDNTVKNTEIKVSNLNDGKNYLVTGGLKSVYASAHASPPTCPCASMTGWWRF